MKKLWYIMIFYSHIESYKRLYGIHMKNTKRESVFRHRSCCPVTLLSPVGNYGCDNPQDRDFQECTKMTLLSWMSLPLPEGRRYIPRNPTWAKWSLCAIPGEKDVTSSSFLGVPMVLLHLWGWNPWNCIQGGGNQWRILCVERPWARCKTLVRTKWLYSHV